MKAAQRKVRKATEKENQTERTREFSKHNVPLLWSRAKLPCEKKPCHGQYDCMIAGSKRIPLAFLHKEWRRLKNIPFHVRRYLRAEGFMGTMKVALLRAASRIGIKQKVSSVSVPKYEEVLNLQAGEFVEVKSIQEIRKTLDKNGCFKGLYFMREMRHFCGKRIRVHKQVNRILLESTEEIRKVRNTVLLEGVMCDGHVQFGCDRSCFYYWREAWLRRVEE